MVVHQKGGLIQVVLILLVVLVALEEEVKVQTDEVELR
jgi:hypothetical protein